MADDDKETTRRIDAEQIESKPESPAPVDQEPIKPEPEQPARADNIDSEQERLMRAVTGKLMEKGEHNATTRLTKADLEMLMTHQGAFGLRVGDAQSYQVLPTAMAAEAAKNPQMLRWRIEFSSIGVQSDVVGLDICGDVVLGRAGGKEDDPDFDLTPYQAAEKGVSRRHALLRPSANKLYLIDLESTNGSRVNSVPVTGAKALADQDSISLGNLVFLLKIIDTRSSDG
jgi:hypothetical protein